MVDNRHKACGKCGYYYRECACGGRDPHGYQQGYSAGKRDTEIDLTGKKQLKLSKTGAKSWRIS